MSLSRVALVTRSTSNIKMDRNVDKMHTQTPKHPHLQVVACDPLSKYSHYGLMTSCGTDEEFLYFVNTSQCFQCWCCVFGAYLLVVALPGPPRELKRILGEEAPSLEII